MRILFNFVIIIVLGFTSCKKQRKDYFGNAEVTLNGEKYSHKFWADKSSGKLVFQLYQDEKMNNVSVIMRSLFFSGVALEISSQKFQLDNRDLPRCGFSTSQDDGCVVGDIFKLDTTGIQNSFVKITRQKNNFEEIWGEFNVKLIRTYSCNCTELADKLEFSKGTFHIVFND